MNKKHWKKLWMAVGMLLAFILWTVLICVVDVRPIGPRNSQVGFATLNEAVHSLTGVHLSLYVLTDWLSLIPVCVIAGFGLLGLYQWIGQKSIFRVDKSILVLGGFYAVVFVVYVFFEQFPVNYRPILLESILEASYPSSTTMLVLCVMTTAEMQLHTRIKNKRCRQTVTVLLSAFTAFMVVGRLLSGVHWVTDIIGGILLSVGLVLMYDFLIK